MKKLMMTLACLLTASTFCSHAQTEKGDVMLGGNVDVLINSNEDETKIDGDVSSKWAYERRQFSITPRVGYFVDDNLAAGLGLSYQNLTRIDPKQPEIDDTTKEENISQTFQIRPNIRYYIPITDELSFFGQASAFYEFGNEKVKLNGEEQEDQAYDINGFGGALRPGLTWFVSDKIGINFSVPSLVSYSYTKNERSYTVEVNDPDNPGSTISQEASETDINSTFNMNLRLSNLSLGVNVFL